ncbi:putative UPF0481 protein At3g02645 [Prosopis cineraria]|uniref:putative UPF0481 protein At3g02645 n=1 Tax=Prosopis cineraria TaxID=364024 RepID=UPI00240E9EC5|nr:putative UPF0481 protein At3g02645 [Prosopis cineraria]
MSSLRYTISHDSKSNSDELRWVIQIRRTLEEELEDDGELPVSIFNVPKLLMVSDPDSYVPQQVAIGPYHYWRPELYEMERYKLAAAKRFQKQLQNLRLEKFVQQLTKLEQRIRACYHKFLDFNGETLAWMMAVDASFLLEFLQVYAIEEGSKVPGKSAHNAILRDIVMLENQLPLFVLREMLEFKFTSLEDADDLLFLMVIGLFKELSPFQLMDDHPNVQVSECAHLLDFFYDMIVPKLEQQSDIVEVDEAHQLEEEQEENEKSTSNPNYVKRFLSELWKLLSKINKGPVRLIKKVLLSRPVRFIIKLPWTIISNLPGLKILKVPVESFFFSLLDKEEEEEEKPENGDSSSNSLINRPPLVEEIAIPSVSELFDSGVRFLPTNKGISSIAFDTKTRTFHLPTINLDVNTEVLLRNLVAYEVSAASGQLVLTRYTELMNGIIDSEEDVKILREKGIVQNHLKSDEEVANMWNGMNRSLRLTKVTFLDEAIEDVNKYYNGRIKVKAWKLMKLYVFSSWQCLTFLAAILLLLLMTLQAFCSVYTCSRIFQVDATDE